MCVSDTDTIHLVDCLASISPVRVWGGIYWKEPKGEMKFVDWGMFLFLSTGLCKWILVPVGILRTRRLETDLINESRFQTEQAIDKSSPAQSIRLMCFWETRREGKERGRRGG